MAFPADYPIRPVHPSPVGSWSNGNLSVTRQFIVPCERLEDFIESMLTTASSTCGLPSTFPGWPTVFISDINWEPISACCFKSPEENYFLTDPTTELEGYRTSESASDYSVDDEVCWCKVVVKYATRVVTPGQSGVREGTWVTYSRNMSGTAFTLPSRNLYWEGIGERLRHDTQAHKFVPMADIVLDWHFIDEADMCFTEGNLLDMQGRVNSNTYGGFLFPGVCADIWLPETLLFLGYSTQLDIGSRSVFGTYCSAVEMKRSLKLQFKMLRVFGFEAVTGDPLVAGWNHSYYDGNCFTPGWRRVVDEFGNNKYESVSFSNIFL